MNAKHPEFVTSRQTIVLKAVFFFGLLSFALKPTANGQQTSPANANPGSGQQIAALKNQDDQYRIGPRDVIDIKVFERPQLSLESVRVDGRGMIHMPLIKEEIRAACRTELELAQDIATRYLEYQTNPQVHVFVKEFNSQPVAIIGAVNTPSRFQLQRRVRLLELLAFANGPSDKSGRTVHVIHNNSVLDCGASESATTGGTAAAAAAATSNTDNDPSAPELNSYNLNDVLNGNGAANPYLRPGDIVSIPEAEQAFVVGNVLNPRPIPLKDPISITRAIAMAGGTAQDAKKEAVRIIRQTPGSTAKTELTVNLKQIEKQQAPDVILLPGDIVDVPTSAGKRFLRGLLGTISTEAFRTPVRIIH